ncbi:MAG TPA: glycosyltransferase [Acidimicrobiales bacterium]|nr:glycosyltransferase [Acidimicrobiales bacterium]
MTETVPALRAARVLRIIARLNIGGPAHHVSILSGRLDPARFETLLVAGRLGRGEGSLEHLAERHGAQLTCVRSMGPELRPWHDLRALVELVVLIRRFRPDIVHTHTAKGGTLGRLAALTMRPRPIVVHTYHGHVLSGYFGERKSMVFRRIEQLLARFTDCLIGVSAATVDDLVAMGIAPRERFRVIYNGLDLEPFLAVTAEDGAPLRKELGATDDDLLVAYIGRLVPIKRVDVLLDAVCHARSAGARVRVAIAGDGELRSDLEAQARALKIDDVVTFLGFRDDLPELAAASDVVVLCSDQEAMGMALVEAAAAGRPGIATDVGGVSELLPPDALVPPGDPRAMGDRLAAAAADREGLRRRGAEAREQVRELFSYPRLLADVEDLYEELLRNRAC